MKTAKWIPLSVGLLSGVVAIVVLPGANLSGDHVGSPRRSIAVLTVKNEIPQAAAISGEMLTTLKMDAALPIQGTFSSPDELIGRVSATTIVPGVPIVEAMLAPPGTLPGTENEIAVGYRLVSIPVKPYAVRHLEPGRRVDVLSSGRSASGGADGTSRRPVLQNAKVFAVGNQRVGMEPDKGRVDSVALLVAVGDVRTLTAAVAAGDVTLVMRGAQDDEVMVGPIPPVYTVPVEPVDPPRQKPTVWEVRVVRGDKAKNVMLSHTDAGWKTQSTSSN